MQVLTSIVPVNNVRIEDSTTFRPLVDIAKTYYEFGAHHKHYHNWDHAMYVLDKVRFLLEYLSPKVQKSSLYIQLAAVWHDAIYVPGAGSNHNEILSAQALNLEARSIGFDYEAEVFVNCAKTLICNTSIEQHLNLDCVVLQLQVLLDADLASLALDTYDEFVDVQHRIILENTEAVTDSALALSADFLAKFLEKKQIYRTDKAQSMWEDQARSNIERWVDTYK